MVILQKSYSNAVGMHVLNVVYECAPGLCGFIDLKEDEVYHSSSDVGDFTADYLALKFNVYNAFLK